MAQWDDVKYGLLTDLVGALEFLVRDDGVAAASQIKRLKGLHFLTARLTPAQIVADQNDYAPAGLSAASVLRLSTDVARTITGLTGGIKDRLLAIVNVGAADLILAEENAGSAAANRFAFALTVKTKQACILWYDLDAARWRLMSKTPSGGDGDVVGPAGATDNHLALFNGATGKLIKDGGAVPTGDVVGPAGATDSHLALFNGATGKLIKDGGAIFNDAEGDPAPTGTAADGTSTFSARRNHVHAVGFNDAEGDPARVAETAADGTSAYPSRRDHAHAAGRRIMILSVVDAGTALTVSDGKMTVFIPPELNGWNLVDADACVMTVSSSGLPTIQIANVTDAVDMLTTKITIDVNEKTSYTATTAPVIDAAHDDVATGDELRIDVDVAGTGTNGLQVTLTFQAP